MQELVINGPTNLPGDLYVVRENGERENLHHVKEGIFTLDCERHLKDGDVIIFNRKPSLHKMSMMGHKMSMMGHKMSMLGHKMSMMGHKIKILPYSTFLL